MAGTSAVTPAFLRNAALPQITRPTAHAIVCEVSGDTVEALEDELRRIAASLDRDQLRGAYMRGPSNVAASYAYRHNGLTRSDAFFKAIQHCIQRISLTAPCYRDGTPPPPTPSCANSDETRPLGEGTARGDALLCGWMLTRKPGGEHGGSPIPIDRGIRFRDVDQPFVDCPCGSRPCSSSGHRSGDGY
jgi:hypothetical protein